MSNEPPRTRPSAPAFPSMPAPAAPEPPEPPAESGPVRIAVRPQPTASQPPTPTAPPSALQEFLPREARTWEELGLNNIFVELMVLRFLLQVPAESARTVAQELCIHFNLAREVLESSRAAKLVQHRGTNKVGDFIFELTEAGRNAALDSRRQTNYVGPAPVPFEDYLESISWQTIGNKSPGPDDLVRAFHDLMVSDELLERLGPAVNGSKSMFLFGDPGNGKTSLAERITRCFGDEIWIPQTLSLDGVLVKLYDPAVHFEVPRRNVGDERIDRRWVRIRRPTVITGGELTLDMLEVQVNNHTNVHEAPLQLKANGGTLVIDDFGRQRMQPQELLNRWIFPLEKRTDFLRLPDGRKLAAPFDCLLVFSTNLEPRNLADEAFLRRIPYKIRVEDPNEDEFKQLTELLAVKMKVQLPRGSTSYLVDRHFKMAKRPMRFCHPRDLLMQVVHRCQFERRPPVAMPEDWDKAVQNYFGAV